MHKHLLKTAWLCLILAFLLCFYQTLTIARSHPSFYAVELLFVAGVAAIAFLTVRIYVFHRHLRDFVRNLLKGDYNVGVKVQTKFNDELTTLERLLNKLAEQLRAFDELFSDRVSMSHRAFELLFRAVDQAIIVADAEKHTFRFNPAAAELFGIDQRSFSFDTIENLAGNEEFVAQFRKSLNEDKLPVEKTLTLRIPARNAQRTLRFKIVPLKDYTDRVQLLLFFVLGANAV